MNRLREFYYLFLYDQMLLIPSTLQDGAPSWFLPRNPDPDKKAIKPRVMAMGNLFYPVCR